MPHPGKPLKDSQWLVFEIARREGKSIAHAAAAAGMSRSTANRASNHVDGGKYPGYQRALDALKLTPRSAQAREDLTGEPLAALEDFGLFRRRYFGRVAPPWSVHTANVLAKMLESPHKEYACVTLPPGSGKSTLFTMDLPAWMICRDRSIRIMLCSAAKSTAEQYTQQLRREFERTSPMQASDNERRKGLAFDAVATLAEDYGNFKPPRGEPWTAEQFVVVQAGDLVKTKKEPTVSAFGRDSRFLGNRVDLAVWDDVVDEKNVRNPEAREALAAFWPKYAETRVEPGGLMVLQGQRLHADDLYRTVLDYTVSNYGDDADVWNEPTGTRRQYTHINYQAHYDDLCTGDHHPGTARPYDPADKKTSGCLLDPRRLLFRDLMVIRDKDPRLYAVSYQQEDVDPASVLVPILHINGGRDPDTGEEFPGCWDRTRVMGVVPKNLTRTKPWLSILSADPSPSRYWSCQWWLHHRDTDQQLLIDHARRTMGANDFLDFDISTGTFSGLLEEWHQVSVAQGAPITHVVVENNAAQRFLLQYDYVKQWSNRRKVQIISHATYSNKTDPVYGIQALLPSLYRFGRVRLPMGDNASRGKSMALVNEVSRYPETATDDCVLAQWFQCFVSGKLYQQLDTPANPPRFSRPGWLSRSGVA
jgi:hypothetical protein